MSTVIMNQGEPLYVILYRDGTLGEPHPWQATLFFVALVKNIAHPFRAVAVFPARWFEHWS